MALYREVQEQAGEAPLLAAEMMGVLARSAVQSSVGQPSAMPPRRDYATAYSLLDRASQAFQVLIARCRELDGELQDVTARASAQLLAAEAVTEHWQQVAGAMQAHLEDRERRLADMQRRLDAAEAHAAAGKQLAEAAERQAGVAFDLTTMFHDRIVAAFGVGSQAHAAMDAVARAAGRQGSKELR